MKKRNTTKKDTPFNGVKRGIIGLNTHCNVFKDKTKYNRNNFKNKTDKE